MSLKQCIYFVCVGGGGDVGGYFIGKLKII